MNFLKVPDRLADFCTRVNARRRSLHEDGDLFEQYLLSFDAHYELVTIHPWADGNGRMSRLVMNHLQFEYGLVPTKINKDDKAEYIQALVASREQDSMDSFREFMLQEHIKNLQQEISTFKEAMEEVETKGGQKTGKVDRKGGQKTGLVDRKGGQKTREAILDMIADNAHITSTQMTERLGINRSAISKHLKKLQEEGTIRREGPDKGGTWVIN